MGETDADPDDSSVLFVVPGSRRHASTRLRVLNMLPYLESSGIEYRVLSLENTVSTVGSRPLGKFVFAARLLTAARRYDVLYVHRLLLPKTLLAALSSIGGTLVYDFDDALYATPKWENGGNEAKVEKLNRTIECAGVTVVGSPVLERYACQFTDDVHTMPTALPKERYVGARSAEGSDRNGEGVTIGWIGNSQNLRYLATIEDSLRTVLDSYDHVRLMVITAADRTVEPLVERTGPDGDVSYLEWNLDAELEYLSEADIVVRPLLDDEWTRGKGGFTSVVQAMALGIPVVVTPVSMLEDLVEDGQSGLHAETDDEWVDRLSTLVESPERRARMGDRAFETIDEEGFWTENRAQQLISLLGSLA